MSRVRTARVTEEEIHEATQSAKEAGAEKTREEVAKEFSLEAIEIKDIQERLERVIEAVAHDDEKFANVKDAAGENRRKVEQQRLANQATKLIEHFEGFNPSNKDDDANAYWSLLHIDTSRFSGADEVEMARDKKREEQEAVLDAFRRKMHETAGDLVWLAQQDTEQAGVLMLGIMESVLSHGEDIRGFKKLFEEDFGYIEDDKKSALYAAIEKQGRLGPIPFKDFVKDNFGEKPDDPKRKLIDKEVRNIEEKRKKAHREFIQALMDALPPPELGEQRWNVRPDVAEIPDISTTRGYQAAQMWGKEWERRREKSGGPPAEIPITEQIVETKGRWIFKRDVFHREEHYAKMKKGYVWVRRPDGKLEQKEIEYASIVTKRDLPASSLTGGLQLGRVMERRDDWVSVNVQTYEATDIVTAVDLVRRFQIPPAREMENGFVGIPRTVRTPDGEWVETWDVVKEEFRQKALEMFQRSQKQFEVLGFDYETEKKKKEMADKRQYRWNTETAPRETSAIEYEVARITVHKEMEIAALEAQADPELAHLAPLIRQAQEGLTVLYRSMEDYGRVKVYEKLARERAQARLRSEGLNPGSAEWTARYENTLAEEFLLVFEYYTQQAIELKKLAEETMDEKHLYAQATPEQRAEMKKARLEKLANLDVEAQTRIVIGTATESDEARKALGILSTNEAVISDEVRAAMGMARRPTESQAEATNRLNHAMDTFSDTATDANENLLAVTIKYAGARAGLIQTELDLMQMQGATPQEIADRRTELVREYNNLGNVFADRLQTNIHVWQERLARQRPEDFRNNDILREQERILARLNLPGTVTNPQRNQLRNNQDRQNINIVVANLTDGTERMQELIQFGNNVADDLELAQEIRGFNDRFAAPM